MEKHMSHIVFNCSNKKPMRNRIKMSMNQEKRVLELSDKNLSYNEEQKIITKLNLMKRWMWGYFRRGR